MTSADVHFPGCAGNAQVQRSGVVDPRVGSIEVVGTAAVARRLADLPFVAAEAQLSRRRIDRALAFDRRHGNDLTSRGRQHVGARRRLVFGIDEKRGVFSAEMRRIPPGAVGADIRKGLVRQRLHPPAAASRVDHDLLSGASACDVSGDWLEALGAANARAWDQGEAD